MPTIDQLTGRQMIAQGMLQDGIQYRSFQIRADQIQEDGSFEGLASAFGVEDSYGTEWEPGAWKAGTPDLESRQFAFLWMHSPYEPIGVFTAEERKDGLWIKGKYDATDEGNRARIRAKSGSAAELSVGFYVRGWRDVDEDGNDSDTVVLTATELMETSQITRNFAAQPGAALTDVRQKRETATEPEETDEESSADEADGERVLLDVKRRAAVARLTLEGVNWRAAIPSHSTATSDGPWDASATKKNIPKDATASTLRKVYAWIDPDKDPDTKGAYKFPHHEVGADGKVGAANVRACVAGIAVLNGGRGGADIPDADVKGVYNHLARHIKDSGATPPDLK